MRGGLKDPFLEGFSRFSPERHTVFFNESRTPTWTRLVGPSTMKIHQEGGISESRGGLWKSSHGLNFEWSKPEVGHLHKQNTA